MNNDSPADKPRSTSADQPSLRQRVDVHAEQERLRSVSQTRADSYDHQARRFRSLSADLDDNEMERRAELEMLREAIVRQQLPLTGVLDLTLMLRRGAKAEDLLSEILKLAVRIFEADKATILVPDETRHYLRIAAALTSSEPINREFYLPIDQGIAGYAFRTGERLVIDNTLESEYFLPDPNDTGPAKYMVAVPLVAQDETLGVLCMERPVAMRASLEKVDQLHAYAAHAAVQLRNIQVYDELMRRVQELSVLCEISRELSSSLEHEEVLQEIVESACQLLNCGICSLMLFDDDKQGLSIQHAVGLPQEVVENARVRVGQGPSGWVAETGQALLLEDINQDPRFRRLDDDKRRASKYRTSSLLSVPLLIGTEIVGVLNVNNKANNLVFTQHDCDNLTMLASHAAVSIENARLYETLQQLAVTDPLTKLFRRNYFEDAFQQELVRAQRYGRPLSVMMLDIDHFKQVNDNYGHPAGDAVLVALAGLLRRFGRKNDIIARFGGEEFVVLLVETDEEGAQIAAERVRAAAEAFEFDINRAEPLRLTVSVGFSTFPQHGADAAALVAAADLALYAAKHGGRNQVCCYHDGLQMPEGSAVVER